MDKTKRIELMVQLVSAIAQTDQVFTHKEMIDKAERLLNEIEERVHKTANPGKYGSGESPIKDVADNTGEIAFTLTEIQECGSDRKAGCDGRFGTPQPMRRLATKDWCQLEHLALPAAFCDG